MLKLIVKKIFTILRRFFFVYLNLCTLCITDCGLPTVLENGDFQIQTDTLTDAIATYSCDSGYTLVGDADVTCQVNGQWEAPPNCAISKHCHNRAAA